jgi:hypothetical protein
MSQFADELLARLAVAGLPSRHDPLTGDADRRLAEVRSWYLEQLSAHPLGWNDLTPFEQRFRRRSCRVSRRSGDHGRNQSRTKKQPGRRTTTATGPFRRSNKTGLPGSGIAAHQAN